MGRDRAHGKGGHHGCSGQDLHQRELGRLTGTGTLEVIDSTTEEVMATIPDGTVEDVDRAVQAAAAAFPAWSATSREERGKTLIRIGEALAARTDEIATIISHEVGMPFSLSGMIQVAMPAGAFADAVKAAESFPWEEEMGNSLVVREPVGVVGAITPWNYPLLPDRPQGGPGPGRRLHRGAQAERGRPVERLRAGRGHPRGGTARRRLQPGHRRRARWWARPSRSHPKVDMVSFTGSTRAGKRVMELASHSITRVSLELGGKSANILLDDADFDKAVPAGLFGCYMNSGQTCSALTRMLVPRDKLAEVEQLALAARGRLRSGRPLRRGQAPRPTRLRGAA